MVVVRPMLCFSRADIDAYVEANHLPYVDDSTNAALDARRNRIRHRLMPLLRELYPSVDATMQANLRRLAEVAEVCHAHVASLRATLERRVPSRLPTLGLDFVVYRLADLAALHPRRTLLFELLRPYGFSAATVDSLLPHLADPAAATGRTFRSPTHEALLDRGRLLVAPLIDQVPAPQVDVASIAPDEARRHLGLDPLVAHLDADRLRLPLTLRPWQPADRFQPLGMEHPRLVSDFLKDLKLNRIEKRHVHLLLDADGRVAWVVGLRPDHRCRLTPGTTRCLRVMVNSER